MQGHTILHEACADCASPTKPGDSNMSEPKLEVPTELRYMAEKAIEQAEKAFSMFFNAANKSIASIPHPATEVSKQALSFAEQNMKASFDHARKLAHAADLRKQCNSNQNF
jgi:hypothetical protein